MGLTRDGWGETSIGIRVREQGEGSEMILLEKR